MRETLYIRLSAAESVSWLLEAATVQFGSGRLAEAAALAAGRQVVVLVPGTDVVLADVAVPTRNRARMVAAVPYLLEEQLAADVDESHFALGERDAADRVAVAVVSRARMDHWLARLAEAGLQADKLIPETLLLPHQDGEWSLLLEPQTVTLRCAVQGGMAFDADNAAFMLRRTLAEQEDKPAVWRAWLAEGAAVTLLPDEPGVELIAETLDIPPLAFLARQAHDPAVIDLLQGQYSRRERLGKLWRPWRPAAALLAVWAALQFAIAFYDYRDLRAEEARLRNEIAQIYLQTFPEAKRVVDARLQMEQHLNALRGGGGEVSGFMKLLAAVATGLGGIDVDHLSYKEGEINLALTVSDLQALDQLKNRLGSETHMTVEIQSATTRNDRVEARIQVRRGRT